MMNPHTQDKDEKKTLSGLIITLNLRNKLQQTSKLLRKRVVTTVRNIKITFVIINLSVIS